ncbi:MAG TPA: pyridoxamine 5'-phosphate oxidase family protein [Gemmatimonadales bacterium]|nr:pyridoxamine 5'-phosphate oxidase family protein [Gemmatimonadales bacterium]
MAHDQHLAQADTEPGSRLQEIVDAIRCAMVTTIDRGGAMHTRATPTQRIEADGSVWFVAAAGSALVRQLREQPACLITYGDARLRRYVSMSGVATVMRCERSARELWDDSVATLFPDGPADPDVVVVKVEVDTAEYWDPVPAPVAFPKFMQAVTTGEVPRARRPDRPAVMHAPQAREE